MKNLKSLVSKANSGLTLNSKTNKRFGLGSFIAASSDQMLMTRGGYGPPQWDKNGCGTRVYTSGMGRLIGGGGASTGDKYTPDQHHMNPSTRNTSSTPYTGYQPGGYIVNKNGGITNGTIVPRDNGNELEYFIVGARNGVKMVYNSAEKLWDWITE